MTTITETLEGLPRNDAGDITCSRHTSEKAVKLVGLGSGKLVSLCPPCYEEFVRFRDSKDFGHC